MDLLPGSVSVHSQVTSDPPVAPLGTSPKRLACSRNGYEFDPEAFRWQLSKDRTLNLEPVLKRLDPAWRKPYRAVLCYYAKNYSPHYCINIHAGVAKLLKDTNADGISESVLRRYRKNLPPDQEYRLGSIKAFLLRWPNQGYPGVSSEAVDYLKSQRLKGNEKGRAVLSLDPNKGPFDDQESGAILDAVAQGYERGRISLDTLALILLLVHTGRRLVQLSYLRAGDLQQSSTSDGRIVHVLQIPRSKQRG